MVAHWKRQEAEDIMRKLSQMKTAQTTWRYKKIHQLQQYLFCTIQRKELEVLISRWMQIIQNTIVVNKKEQSQLQVDTSKINGPVHIPRQQHLVNWK